MFEQKLFANSKGEETMKRLEGLERDCHQRGTVDWLCHCPGIGYV